jgi:DNA-binding transcriptional LysR family regulator
MEMQHVRGFVFIAELRSVSKAARLLNLTQPTLSRQIISLEHEVGATLFSRGREMELTREGEAFLPNAQRLLYDADQALMEIREERAHCQVLHIGYTSALMYAFLAEVLVAYKSASPNMEIALTERTPTVQVSMLEHGQLDLLVIPPVLNTVFNLERIARAPLVYALPVHLPFVGGENCLSSYRDQKFVVPFKKDYPNAISIVRDACHSAGFEPKLLEVDGMTSVLTMVGLGKGISILPAYYALLPHLGVRFETFSAGDTHSSIYVMTRERCHPAHVALCIDLMKKFASRRFETRFWLAGAGAPEKGISEP